MGRIGQKDWRTVDSKWDAKDFERRLNELTERASGASSTVLQREVEAMTCPTHGKPPQVTVKGTGKKAEFRVGGFCCDEFADTVNAYLASASECQGRLKTRPVSPVEK